MIRIALTALSLLALPATAIAQDKQAESGQPPKRIKSVTIGATEKCPESTADEIVVCTKIDNPYRIPKELRDSGPIAPKNQAWTTRLATDEQTSREAAGLPDTCSPVGTGGQTGCARAAARAFKADKRAKGTKEDPNQPAQ
ncbi:MAG: hypothetical protein JSR79_09780 [Proteobacteria bacterium]|nr:hypothetical protein [Pseudomonadota bacterium]